jgi:N-terminal domain of CBF1 interacting co-repressor CIR
LGKKSWNVYNRDNIDRVRRDEAEAHNREEEEDRRLQDAESERRLKLLRGHQIDNVPAEEEHPASLSRKKDRGHNRKRRKLAGEDDTDRDLRLAKERASQQSGPSDAVRMANEPLIDSEGHINLFPPTSRHKEKNAEAEADQAKKQREYEDQYTMRFSNAAGVKQNFAAPWYSNISKDNMGEVPGKDVWGNEDSGRRERERMRTNANDPLAAMKKGIKQLRDVEKSRKDWLAERNKEMQELEPLEKSRPSNRRHRRRRRDEDDSRSLDDFSLDVANKDYDKSRSRRRRSRAHHHHHHHHHTHDDGDHRSGRSGRG